MLGQSLIFDGRTSLLALDQLLFKRVDFGRERRVVGVERFDARSKLLIFDEEHAVRGAVLQATNAHLANC